VEQNLDWDVISAAAAKRRRMKKSAPKEMKTFFLVILIFIYYRFPAGETFWAWLRCQDISGLLFINRKD
jgi:hypothetical protein